MLNLRQRSGFSFRAAFGQLDEVMALSGGEYAALTDRASTFGHIRWEQLCKKNGKKPIFGVELSVVEQKGAKKTPGFYATFIAHDSVESIYELFNTATRNFRYEPRLEYEDVERFCAGGRGTVILGDRCNYSRLGNITGCYAGVHAGSPAVVVRNAIERGIRLLAVSENFYPTAFDKGAYEVLVGRGASSQTYPRHILTRDEWLSRWGREPWAQAALDAQHEIAAQCTASLKKAHLFVPEHDMTLREMCFAGAIGKDVDLWNNPVYRDRLERELSVIKAKDFEDYFYIIADLMKEAKRLMFCGPARGSSCGSLVCYLLDITTVDPIKFDLIFERFIDVNRSDLPDIDIDLSDEKRELVFQYLRNKYGEAHVAQLGTIMFYKVASTIKEVCGALGISPYDLTKFSATIEDRDEGHPRVNDCIADALETDAGKAVLEKHPEFAIATRIEGHPRHYSRHAAGVIITADPLDTHVAIDDKVHSTQCEKRDAEKMDMLKVDLLGLTQLSVFEHALDLIKKPREWLVNYPLDDAGAFEVLNSGRLTGIFQFAGAALREMTKQVNVTTFEDIVSLTSLARPGPMQSGGSARWIKCKNDESLVTYDHPSLEPILKNTYGCVVYQEQVMRICREIGGMDWPDVSALRKAMGKTMGVEYFNKWKDKFIPGALAVGFKQNEAEWFWQSLCENGSYLFNRSHAVAYSFISYWCAVLKKHHPAEFAAATLSSETDNDKIIALLRDLDNEGFGYIPFDRDNSGMRWTVAAGGKLIGPLMGLKGIGQSTAQNIIDKRRSGALFTKRQQELLSHPETPYDSLYPIRDRFAEVFADPASHNILSPITKIEKLTEQEKSRDIVVIAEVKKVNERDKNDAYNLEKRDGKRYVGESRYVSLLIEDDTSSIYANISTKNYGKLAAEIIATGVDKRPVYLFKGRIGPGFRLIHLERYKLLGFLEASAPDIDAPEVAENAACAETETA